MKLNGAPVPGVTVRLNGPADVRGLDPNQVLRTDPVAGTTDFEPNAFASIELDRPDMPWLFTPARADANAEVLAQFEPGVIANVKTCSGGWCRVVVVLPGAPDVDGVIRQDRLWGVYPNEKVE